MIEINRSLIHIILCQGSDVLGAHQIISTTVGLLPGPWARGSLQCLLLLRKHLGLLLLVQEHADVIGLCLDLLELDSISWGKVHEGDFDLIRSILPRIRGGRWACLGLSTNCHGCAIW